MTVPDCVMNVKDFGAIGDGRVHLLRERFATIEAAKAIYPHANDIDTESIDWAAIQATINTASETRAGTICVPAGEYKISSSGLRVPRAKVVPDGHGGTHTDHRPLRIIGAGVDCSVLSGHRLDEFDPVLGFEQQIEGVNSGARHFGLENISIGRANAGYVFHFSDDGERNHGLETAVFRNVAFRSAPYYDHGATGWVTAHETQTHCVSISGGHQLVFDNIRIRGGESGLFLRECSRVTANMLHIDQDGGCHTGIRIEDGGTMQFTGVRIEGCPKGSGFVTDGTRGVRHILIDGITFETKGEKYLLNLRSVVGCNIRDLSMGTIPPELCPSGSAYGLYIGEQSRNVTITTGVASPLRNSCGEDSRAVFIHPKAQFIRIAGLQIINADPEHPEKDIELGSEGGFAEVEVLLTSGFDYHGTTERQVLTRDGRS